MTMPIFTAHYDSLTECELMLFPDVC